MLSSFFSSEERLRVVRKLFFSGASELRVRVIARHAKVSPALVSSTIGMLKKEKIIVRGAIDFLHPFVRTIKLLLNVVSVKNSGLAEKIFGVFKDCEGAGIYGSWANGTNYADSDIDLWVKSDDENEKKILELMVFVRQKLGVEANLVVLTKKRLKELKEKDFVFYCMLHNSFVLRGEGV